MECQHGGSVKRLHFKRERVLLRIVLIDGGKGRQPRVHHDTMGWPRRGRLARPVTFGDSRHLAGSSRSGGDCGRVGPRSAQSPGGFRWRSHAPRRTVDAIFPKVPIIGGMMRNWVANDRLLRLRRREIRHHVRPFLVGWRPDRSEIPVRIAGVERTSDMGRVCAVRQSSHAIAG